MRPIPVRDFRNPVRDRSYLLYCPEHGGWHTGVWWDVDDPARWALHAEVSITLDPTHILDVPPDPMDASETLAWTVDRQAVTAGSA